MYIHRYLSLYESSILCIFFSFRNQNIPVNLWDLYGKWNIPINVGKNDIVYKLNG